MGCSECANCILGGSRKEVEITCFLYLFTYHDTSLRLVSSILHVKKPRLIEVWGQLPGRGASSPPGPPVWPGWLTCVESCGCWTQSSWSRSVGGWGTADPERICQWKVVDDPAVSNWYLRGTGNFEAKHALSIDHKSLWSLHAGKWCFLCVVFTYKQVTLAVCWWGSWCVWVHLTAVVSLS